MEISAEQFLEFKAVQDSGQTNMLDVRAVSNLSDGLSVEQVKAIIADYDNLAERYSRLMA